MFASSGALASLAGFYVALSAAFALLGMQLYGGRWEDVPPDEPSMPRENFDTFPDAMLTMFAVSTGEGWTNLLYNAMRLEPRATPPFLIVFFVLVNYVLLNLVIATVLEKLELRDDEKQARQRGNPPAHGPARAQRRCVHRRAGNGAVLVRARREGERWSGDAPHNSPEAGNQTKEARMARATHRDGRDAACATTHDHGSRSRGPDPRTLAPGDVPAR